MNSKDIKKSLKQIKKHGDLYDVISKKEGLYPEEHAFLNFQTLLLSRILFVFVLLSKKIKNKFINPEKIKEASDNIRHSIGVNIDIILDKSKEKYQIFKSSKFGILYRENTSKSAYLHNLTKILNFMENYDIDLVYLRIDDILNNFDVDLNSFNTTSLQTILGYFFVNEFDEELLILSSNDLLKLINILKSDDFKKDILDFKDKIGDLVIQKALDDYLCDFDLNKLKTIVTARLSLLLNSDNSFKDKINGKVYYSLILKDQYVKAITKNILGKNLNNTILLLEEYLKDFDDKEEIKEIANLYLVLNNHLEIKKENNKKDLTLYDAIYTQYLAKKNKKKIIGLKSHSHKRLVNLYKFYCSLILSSSIFIMAFITGFSIDFLNSFIFRNNTSVLENIINTIILPYKYSLEFELDLIKEPLSKIRDILLDYMDAATYSITGDSNNNIDKIIAKITPLSEEYPLPTYYASGFAIDSNYEKGSICYMMDKPSNIALTKCKPIFSIDYDLDSGYLDFLIQNNKIYLNEMFYPIGNFSLINICFKDYTSDKIFTIDYDRFQRLENNLTNAEVTYLKEFKNPYISYTYGISYEENIFNADMKDNAYTGFNKETKLAILKGLKLDENATLSDIYTAIKNKKYSKEPLKENGITRKVKTMDELEYMEEIASMDSLICNLAASLIVESSEDLAYVIGYANFDNDEFLRSSEYHAWAMDKEGNIIDATPYISSEEEGFLKNIIDFGVTYHIPLYAILVLASLIFPKIFGKKIKFTFKFNKINKLLESKDINLVYAQINELLYGGINIPKSEEKEVLLKKIIADFAGLEKQELEDLKKSLEEIQDKNTKNKALKLLNEIPFIEENNEELMRRLTKKNS